MRPQVRCGLICHVRFFVMAHNEGGGFTRGSRVELINLVSRATLNGRVGTVVQDYNLASGRWAVETDPPHVMALNVRPANLRLVASMGDPIDVQYLLQQLEPGDDIGIGYMLTNKRIAQRRALEGALRLANGHNAADPLLNDPSCQIVLGGVSALTIQPHELAKLALVCRAWAATVRAWLASPAALPFWQRVCAGVLPSDVVLHPELCTKDMLREWAALKMAVGTKQAWHRCGLGIAFNEEEASLTMTELELGIALANLFKLWWNVGHRDGSPRYTGWMRLYFKPYLTGRTHDTEAHPGTWDLWTGPMPRSLLANVCDCINDFLGHQASEGIPDVIECDPWSGEGLCQTLRALVRKFDCQPQGTQWRYMTAPQITPEKNAAFYRLLRQYCPLFPQASDRTLVASEPVFRQGRRHAYLMPRPEKWRIWPHSANEFLILNKPDSEDEVEGEHWTWDENVGDREHGVIEGESFEWDEEDDEDDADAEE